MFCVYTYFQSFELIGLHKIGSYDKQGGDLYIVLCSIAMNYSRSSELRTPELQSGYLRVPRHSNARAPFN